MLQFLTNEYVAVLNLCCNKMIYFFFRPGSQSLKSATNLDDELFGVSPKKRDLKYVATYNIYKMLFLFTLASMGHLWMDGV